jgi:hypothetical protein
MVCSLILAASVSAAAQGGFFVKRTGVELGVRPGTDIIYKTSAPFYSKTRIGGKLENLCIGASYIAENSYYNGKTVGWAADLGYDIHFGKGWGLNVALEYMSIMTVAPNPFSNFPATKHEDNVFWLPLYFYKQFDVSDKFFIKPTFGIYAGYRNGKTYFYTSEQTSSGAIVVRENISTITQPLFPYLHGGIGFGYNVNDNLVLGAMPMYVPYGNKNVWGLQLSAGYNLYTEESFDSKKKR